MPQQDGKADPETLARAINAEPWEPMVKWQCYWFAAPVAVVEEAGTTTVGGLRGKRGLWPH